MRERRHVQATTLSIFIISDEEIPRESLVYLLQSRPEYKVAGHATLAQAFSATLEPLPAVVLLHAGNLRPLTLVVINSLHARGIPVVVLLRQRNPWQVQACRRAGATGMVLLESASIHLFGVINAAAMHKATVDPMLARALFDAVSGPFYLSTPKLSARESQVLRYIAYGYSNVQISEKIRVGTKSVETYRSRLMEKLDLKDRTDIVRFALTMGVLSANDVDETLS